jgi:hypothetical protein
MRELARINRIQNLISHIWLNHLDLRYGQLIINLHNAYLYQNPCIRDMFYVEDSDWEEFLINFRGFE